jgi:hypothetical protein
MFGVGPFELLIVGLICALPLAALVTGIVVVTWLSRSRRE